MSRHLLSILVLLLFWMFHVALGETRLHDAGNALQLIHTAKADIQRRLGSILVLGNTSTSSHCSSIIHNALHGSTSSPQFEWLLQMYDSSGSPPSGLLSGTVSSLGDYDQCIHISQKYPQFSASQYETQYCILTLNVRRAHKYQTFNWSREERQRLTAWEGDALQSLMITDNRVPIAIGLCLPQSCTAHEATQIANKSHTLIRFFDFKVDYCQSRQDLKQRLYEALPFLLFVACLVALCAAGTGLDALHHTDFGKIWCEYIDSFCVIKVVQCFSLLHSVPSLYDVSNHVKCKQSPREGGDKPLLRIDVLDGIRTWTILWILASHVAAFSQVLYLMKVSPVSHFPDGMMDMKMDNWLMSSYFQTTYLAVSVFFLISGMLLAYKKDNRHKCSGFVHFFEHLFNRFMRITPSLLMTMGITYYAQFAGSGPMFHPKLIEPYVAPCRQYFWYHLFYLQNFLDTNQRCGSHTWYLAADFQLQLIGFFLLHLARCQKRKIFASFVAFVIMAACTLFSLGTILFDYGHIVSFDAYINSQIEVSNANFRLFYYSTHMHAGSFFTGVLLGLLLTTGWSFQFLFKKRVVRVVTVAISLITCFIVPLALQQFVLSPRWHIFASASPLLKGMNFQFLYYVFNISMASLIFITAHNPKMLVSRAISAKWLRPLSRLVFSIYLVHQIAIWYTMQQFRTPILVTGKLTTAYIVMIGGASFFAANVLYVTVEYPFVRLSKLLLPLHRDRVATERMATTNGNYQLDSFTSEKALKTTDDAAAAAARHCTDGFQSSR